MRVFQLVLVYLLGSGLLAQAAGASAPPVTAIRKHLLYFRDKANSPYKLTQPQTFLSARALQRRTRQGIALSVRDLPVNPSYVAQVKAVPGAQLWYTSRWFNAAVVACDSATLAKLNALPCVQSARTLNRGLPGTHKRDPEAASDVQARALSRSDYGQAFTQAQMIGAVDMHNAGFRGEGMQIAVFDGGFPGVDKIPAFTPLFGEKRLASTFNFVEKNKSVFIRDSHGTNTLSTLAANQPGFFMGTAPKATYHLCLTEDVNSEHPVEEVNWLIAAEYADSVGVDVISSSLGYNSFDYPSIDYTYNDMNGRTAISTRAATIAARVGMLVVSSAGNEGGNSWRYITAPADADSILTVGAVDSLRIRASFSSIGPTADGRIKPSLMAQGRASAILTSNGSVVRGNGTSFSCPILAGMAAGFWQANPTLTAQQVISFLERSASRAKMPNDEYGFGIPNFVQANDLVAIDRDEFSNDVVLYPNPTRDEELFLQLPKELQAVPLYVRIIDTHGALVAQQDVPAANAAAVRLQPISLAKGVYLCLVKASGKRQRTVRFVKL
ncbi:S8 family serine peptidase [Hymenobacter sp. BT491]|uniref:S8 family serine peptidase n=1 Tax=Hymenobacter sp. BT491 TaxID=2766779 RepID=UPI001653A140|nr:S8 family serine peptidase [Hymenobacter sp. BT491]MBC6989976.1 S8 family serine peptidase [Hymenobacter sp. BT491]